MNKTLPVSSSNLSDLNLRSELEQRIDQLEQQLDKAKELAEE